jgi:hypothetical protein
MAKKTVSAVIELKNSKEKYLFFKAIYEKFSKWLKEDLGDEYDFKLSADDKVMSIFMERKGGYCKEIVTAKPMGRCLLIETFSPLIRFLICDIIEKIPKKYRIYRHKKRNEKGFKTIQSFIPFVSEPCGIF